MNSLANNTVGQMPISKAHLLYDSICIKFSKCQNNKDGKQISGGQAVGDGGSKGAAWGSLGVLDASVLCWWRGRRSGRTLHRGIHTQGQVNACETGKTNKGCDMFSVCFDNVP